MSHPTRLFPQRDAGGINSVAAPRCHSTIPCWYEEAAMSDPKSSHPKSYPLEILKRLRDTPRLLPHESSKEFLQLFARFEDYGKPQNSRDYLAVHQATVLTWDILRCQDMKVGVLRSYQRPALESLFRKIQVRTVKRNGLGEAAVPSA